MIWFLMGIPVVGGQHMDRHTSEHRTGIAHLTGNLKDVGCSHVARALVAARRKGLSGHFWPHSATYLAMAKTLKSQAIRLSGPSAARCCRVAPMAAACWQAL